MAAHALLSTSAACAPDHPEVYFTRAEAANYVRLGVSTLAKFAMQDAGPAFCRIGHSVRYRKSDLDAWMADRLRRA